MIYGIFLQYLVIVLLFCQSATSHLIPRVVGGTPASASDFSYLAFIENYNQTTHHGRHCTGSLIAPNLIVISAWCLTIFDTLNTPNNYLARVSRQFPSQINPLRRARSVKQAIIHPDYLADPHTNNIALLILSEDVPPSQATPVKIYTGGHSSDSILRVAGFGTTDPNVPNSNPLMAMSVSAVLGSDAFCKSHYTRSDVDNVVCSEATNGQGLCGTYDTGAPLAIRYGADKQWGLLGFNLFNIGIDSNRYNICARDGAVSYYLRAAPYVDWIAKAADLKVSQITTAHMANDNHVEVASTSTDNSQPMTSEMSTASSEILSTAGDHQDRGSKRNTIVAAVCGSVGGVLVVVLAFLAHIWWKKRNQRTSVGEFARSDSNRPLTSGTSDDGLRAVYMPFTGDSEELYQNRLSFTRVKEIK